MGPSGDCLPYHSGVGWSPLLGPLFIYEAPDRIGFCCFPPFDGWISDGCDDDDDDDDDG
jgi:hypothetical protein